MMYPFYRYSFAQIAMFVDRWLGTRDLGKKRPWRQVDGHRWHLATGRGKLEALREQRFKVCQKVL